MLMVHLHFVPQLFHAQRAVDGDRKLEVVGPDNVKPHRHFAATECSQQWQKLETVRVPPLVAAAQERREDAAGAAGGGGGKTPGTRPLS